MKKNKLLLLPFLAGLVFMIYSWYLSYPLSILTTNDFVFYHISIFYWLSLPLLLVSMFLMALTTKSKFLKWILSIGIVLTIFSLPYFYSIMPTGDSQQFRAFVEYFIKTQSLDPSQLNHDYFQWPAFFILADVVTSISGLTVTNYEFLLFTLIGFLLGSALFVYGTKKHSNGGTIVVVAFFISLIYFMNYQPVPFTLALVLLFLLFMLDAHQRNFGVVAATLVLFAGLLLTHLFVPLFFVLFLLMRSLFDNNRPNRARYRNFFIIGLVSYFFIQLSLASFSLSLLVKNITKPPMQSVSYFISAASSTQVQIAINNTAQFFSRTVTITAIVISIVGLIFLLFKRRVNALDKAILFTGAIYSALGIVLNTLGFRAVAVAFVPISLGAAFLFQGKFRPYLIVLFSVLLALFLFIPVHTLFTSEISFQTTQNYVADNFFLNHYNWQNAGFVASDYWTDTYLLPKLNTYQYLFPQYVGGIKADAILYTPQLAGFSFGNYTTMQSLSQGDGLNVVYNDGISYVLVNPNH